MKKPTEFLMNLQRIIKLHDSLLKEICDDYHLSLIEAKILSFLHNNPEKDTAGDIVELRMLAKSNVSNAVELLIQKAMLKRVPDQKDRRKIHLKLLPAAQPIQEAIDRLQVEYLNELFEGFSEDEIQIFTVLNQKIMQNTKNGIQRRKAHE